MPGACTSAPRLREEWAERKIVVARYHVNRHAPVAHSLECCAGRDESCRNDVAVPPPSVEQVAEHVQRIHLELVEPVHEGALDRVIGPAFEVQVGDQGSPHAVLAPFDR